MNIRKPGLIAMALLIAAACGGGGGTDAPAGPVASILIAASPSTATVAQGGTSTFTVSLTRAGGFAGSVVISVTGLPAGVTATVTPPQLTLTSNQAQVTLTLAASVASGTYPLTIGASASGVTSATAPYSLVVTAAPFTLSSNPGTVSVRQGGAVQSDIRVNRTNFTGTVSLALMNPPSGISANFSPASATGDQTTLTVFVADEVAPGPYTLTVLGSAPGTTDGTTTVSLTVTQRPDFRISATPGTVQINAGSTGQVPMSINRTNFTENVSLSLTSPPTGVFGTFAPTLATGTSSTLTIIVGASVPPGNYVLTVTGSAPGLARTTTIALTVAPRPNFTFALSSGTVLVDPGSTSQLTIAIDRTNFTGPVSFALFNAPAGITGTFSPNPTTGNSLTLTISAASSVSPRHSPFYVSGSAAGITDLLVPITVVVPDPVQPDYTLGFSPSTVTLETGKSVQVSVVISRLLNFTGPVTLSVYSKPSEITVSFSSATITGNSIIATITGPPNSTAAGEVTIESNSSVGIHRATLLVVAKVLPQPPPPPPPPPPNASFSLSALATANASATTSVDHAVSIFRSTFEAYEVALSVESAPAGITGVFTPALVTGNGSTLRISVASSVQPGTYTMVIKGSAGTIAATRDITVVVPTPNAFSVSFALQSMTVAQGSQGSVIVRLTRTNFTGPVAFALENAPAGMTAVFSPNPSTGTSLFMNLTVAGSVPSGSYTVMMRGTSPGQVDQTATIPVVVP